MIKFTKLKSKNKKGFAMAELLAVCIVVLTIFTILFSNYLPLVAEYENRSVYNNVTAQYAAHHFRKAYAEAIASTANKVDTQNIEKIISGGFEGDDYITVYEKNKSGDVKEILNHFNDSKKKEVIKLLDAYGIEEIIITPYKLETLKKEYPKEGKLYGYINYLPTYKNYSGEETYRIILKSSEFGYATTPIKYKDISGEQGNKPNHPVLSENMFAVRYFTGTEGSECVSGNSCWKVVSGDEKDRDNWYNYDVGEWANSITVKDSVREEYKVLESNGVGKEVNMDDVLTMQVWIPRFKYTVWNYNSDGTATSNPQQINIQFESGTTTSGEIECTDLTNMGTSDGTESGTKPTTSETCKIKENSATCTNDTCNAKTYTHPAFTFGDKEITGFWVGKFELSSDTNCTLDSSAIGAGCNLTSIRPFVKPNLKSWRGAMVGTFENNMMAMNDSSNIYGFLITDDTHMMKNMEWGAVAYLSHSKYGKYGNDLYEGTNKEIYQNKSVYLTGNSNGTPSQTNSITSQCSYDDIIDRGDGTGSCGGGASTTGNIYGVYDMSGGTSEYVMGNTVSAENKNMSGHYEADNSGFDGILYDFNHDMTSDNTLYDGPYDYPDKRYVDIYSYTDALYSASKLGDGIKETATGDLKSWYGDKITTFDVSNGRVWVVRSGEYKYSSEMGIFYSFADSGGARSFYTSRLAIAILD